MAPFYIKGIKAREILDSRGNPTIEVEAWTERNRVRAAVPSGASTGIHEALELRDGDMKRFHGKGVLKAVENVNDRISKNLTGFDCGKQREIDKILIDLDGTDNKSKLGANAILGASMAVCRLAAAEQGIPLYEHIRKISGNKKPLLPFPAMNILNGGRHAGNDLDVQEYMILPTGERDLKSRIRICSETYHSLKEVLVKKYGKNSINVGDEGGFAPPLKKIEEPLDLIAKVIENLGYEKRIKIGMDVAASEFFEKGRYVLEGGKLTPDKLSGIYERIISKYPVISIEDPFSQDDWSSWSEFTKSYGDRINVIGDDLLVTNCDRIEKAVELKACNSLLLKMNQIGTITESMEAFRLSKKNGWEVMVSHRSGETEDDFISDLSVGFGAEFIKTGAPCRGERTAKYNRLLRICEESCK